MKVVNVMVYDEEYLSVKYTHDTTKVTTYHTQIQDWDNIENMYRNQQFRDKVICRIDVSYYLERYLQRDTIKQYRPVIMMIAKGLLMDANKFSDIMMYLIDNDSKFVEEIVHLYHSCDEQSTFGHHIIQTFADVFREAENDYRSFFRHKPEVVICVSNGYLYFSFEDTERGPLLPDKVDYEVLSYAKNWKGEVRYCTE